MIRHLGGVCALALAGSLLTPSSAQAVPVEGDESVLTTTVTIQEETYTADFAQKLSTVSYDATTQRAPGVVARTGGTSSASGCRKVTVINVKHTILGSVAYKYNTWTSWCWKRAKQKVKDVRVGWYLTDVDGVQDWKGQVTKETYFYDYGPNDGYPRSAYKHFRQGHFENCILKIGCVSNSYPANWLYSYYNGTYVWKTDD